MQASLESTEKTKATDCNQMASESTGKKPKTNTKIAAILKRFIELGDKGMNCFEAANYYHDYVLRTTVSDLDRDYGLLFLRSYEKVPNAFGTLTDCVRYWLDEANMAKAIAILAGTDAIREVA